MRKAAARVLGAVGTLGSFLVSAGSVSAQYYYDYGYDLGTVSGGLFSLGIWSFVWICCCCLWFILAVVFGVVVYNDAKKNNIDNPVVWGLLSFFLGVIGILIYFVAIKPQAKKK